MQVKYQLLKAATHLTRSLFNLNDSYIPLKFKKIYFYDATGTIHRTIIVRCVLG